MRKSTMTIKKVLILDLQFCPKFTRNIQFVVEGNVQLELMTLTISPTLINHAHYSEVFFFCYRTCQNVLKMYIWLNNFNRPNKPTPLQFSDTLWYVFFIGELSHSSFKSNNRLMCHNSINVGYSLILALCKNRLE